MCIDVCERYMCVCVLICDISSLKLQEYSCYGDRVKRSFSGGGREGLEKYVLKVNYMQEVLCCLEATGFRNILDFKSVILK